MPPCVLELQDTLQLDVDSVTLKVAPQPSREEEAPLPVRFNTSSAQISTLLQNQQATLRVLRDSQGLPDLQDEPEPHSVLVDTPQQCDIPQVDWSIEQNSRVVLSCISVETTTSGSSLIRTPLGTAMAIRGAGVVLIGIQFYGCSDTAVTVHSPDVFLAVRL